MGRLRLLLPALLLLSCGTGPEEKTVTLGPHTYRAIAGASMGAIGAGLLGARHPDRFDAIGALGGPLDADAFLSYLEGHYLGGFCTLGQLEEILAAHPGDPEVLNDPSRLPCMEAAPSRLEAVLAERRQRYDRWAFTQNGGSFDRDQYLNLFEDLISAFGNPLYGVEASTPFPPGVSEADLLRGDICERPLSLQGVSNKEYNPEGTYPVVTFCDGEARIPYCSGSMREVDRCAEADPEEACKDEGGVAFASLKRNPSLYLEKVGTLDPCAKHERVVRFAVAVDLNRNGRRDHGEPIVLNGHERFQDVGADGCANPLEDGEGGCVSDARESPFSSGEADPNGDDFDWRRSPRGTEGNFAWDPGEPFEDFGLDGVEGTGDEGEGDGLFSESEGRLRLRSFDARRRIRHQWSQQDREQKGFYLDGGIRDVFHFGIHAALLFGELQTFGKAGSRLYTGTASFPGAPQTEDAFFPLAVKQEDLPQNVLYLYGDPAASEGQIAAGDGDHVGTTRQVMNRLLLFLHWVSIRWSEVEDPPADRSSFWSRAHSLRFASPSLGGMERDFAVILPPGYDDPANAEARYPVLYLLHGYGQRAAGPGGFWESFLLFDGRMASGEVRKMILVFPSGRCCFQNESTGETVCTEEEGSAEGFQRACRSGTFFVDSIDTGRRYGASLFDLIEHVDSTYRTLAP